tara:strand:- start:1609 stop:2676 length:1068 start_codon:yes stop_codon:yes gene_type:complete
MSGNIETGTSASRVLFINSADTELLTNTPILTTDYRFIPDEAIVVPPHHTILISLHHTAIPFSFYNFQTNRNVMLDFGLSAYGSISTTDTGSIQLKEGNYNARTLADEITTKINSATGGNLQIKYNRDTLKYEYNWTPPADASKYRLTLRIADGANNLINFKDELGFNKNKFVNGVEFNVYFENNTTTFRCGYSLGAGVETLHFTAPSLTSFWNGFNTGGTDNIFSAVDVNSSIRSLYVRTNLTTNSVLDSAVGGGFSSILARIPIDVNSGGVITISPSDGSVHKLLLKVREITTMGVRLTDQRNRLIDLNGLNWDISIQFDFIETPTIKVPKDKRLEIHERQYQRYKDKIEKSK